MAETTEPIPGIMLNKAEICSTWPELKYRPPFEDNYGDDRTLSMRDAFPEGANRGWTIDKCGRMIIILSCSMEYVYSGTRYNRACYPEPPHALVYIYERCTPTKTNDLHNWRITVDGTFREALGITGCNLLDEDRTNITLIQNLLANNIVNVCRRSPQPTDPHCYYNPPIFCKEKVDLTNTPGFVYAMYLTLAQ